MKRIFAAAASIVAAMTCAWGQDSVSPKNYFLLGLGGFAIADDDVTINSSFGPVETTNDVDLGIALSGLIGRRLTEYLSVEAELGIYSASWDGFENDAIVFVCDDDDDCLDETITTAAFTVNGVLSAPMDAKFRPYVGFGGGFMRTSYNLDNVDGDTGFGYIVKAGADVPITPGFRAGLQYTYLGAPEVDFDGGFATFDVAGGAVLVTFSGGF